MRPACQAPRPPLTAHISRTGPVPEHHQWMDSGRTARPMPTGGGRDKSMRHRKARRNGRGGHVSLCGQPRRVVMTDVACGIVVTGAAGEIGTATCRRLLDSGHRVVAVDIDEAAGKALLESL